MKDIETKYHVICLWWLSCGVAIEEGLVGLLEWVGFKHFCYQQWCAHMLLVRSLSIFYIR